MPPGVASGAVGPKLEPAEMGNKKLWRNGKYFPREERKTMTTKRQLDDMKQTNLKVVKAAAPRLERSRVANERVGGKDRLRGASDDARSGGEATQELRGMFSSTGKTRSGTHCTIFTV